MGKKILSNNREAAELLRDTGLLFEINRKVLHPLGLALAVHCDSDGTVLGFSGLTDCCNDPEGMLFNENTPGAQKFRDFMNGTGKTKLQARLKALGFTIQSFPGID